jgi:putative Mg2+ transporter-C (MgtC) family protein
MLPHSELLLRIAVGALLGGVIGYERDRHGRPVGLRTHLLVALASATFMVVSTHFAYYQGLREGDLIEVDASRIAASVVSAIGFLAGGAILRSGMSVQGLTTAAGLWLVTAIGLCAGGGMYIEATFSTALGVVILTVLRRFEDKEDGIVRRQISLSLDVHAGAISAFTAALERYSVRISELDYEKQIGEKTGLTLTFEARHPHGMSVDDLVAALEQQPGVTRLRIRPQIF